MSPNWVPGDPGRNRAGKPRRPKGLKLEWEYRAAEGWTPFSRVSDQSHGFSASGEALLEKEQGPDTVEGAVNGVKSHWIRARVQSPMLSPAATKGPANPPMLDTVKLNVSTWRSGLDLDAAQADGLSLDTSKDFFPLGTAPAVSSGFVFACDAAFQQPGAQIEIALNLSKGSAFTPSADLELVWEYSVGDNRWSELGTEARLDDRSKGLTAVPMLGPAISFYAPTDWQKSAVNGESHWWMRIRIAKGGYGGPPTYTLDNGQIKVANLPQPPHLASLKVACTQRIGPLQPDHCLSLNGFAFQDQGDANRWGSVGFTPFSAVDDALPSVHLGFGAALPEGMVSVYFAAPSPEAADGSSDAVPFTWEYLAPEGWAELPAIDETAGFTRSGTVRFIGPPDHTPSAGPAGPAYWIRARFKEPAEVAPLAISGVWANAVWATQRSTVRGEVAGRSDGGRHQVMAVQRPPMLEGEVIEVQEWHGTGREWESLFAGVAAADLRHDRDGRGRVVGVWVRWHERPHLLSSGPLDRVYAVERSRGLLRFGDGVSGMVPPGAAVMASYDYGGGTEGNLPAGQVSELHSGGALRAVGDQCRRRQRRRRRGDASGGAAAGGPAAAQPRPGAGRGGLRVAGTGGQPRGGGGPLPARPRPRRRRPAGRVTVLVAPWSAQLQPVPSPELMRRVRDHLARFAPAAIAAQIRVAGPAYVPVSVIAEVVPRDPGMAAELEDALVRRLDGFLHPVNGGPFGAGGSSVRRSRSLRLPR